MPSDLKITFQGMTGPSRLKVECLAAGARPHPCFPLVGFFRARVLSGSGTTRVLSPRCPCLLFGSGESG